jgi:hypothetical protein
VREGKGIILNLVIVPEGGGRAISNVNESDVPIGGKLVVNDFPKVRGRSRCIIREYGFIVQKQSFQGAWALVNSLSTNFSSRHLFWVCKSFRPSPPSSFLEQTCSQATRH